MLFKQGPIRKSKRSLRLGKSFQDENNIRTHVCEGREWIARFTADMFEILWRIIQTVALKPSRDWTTSAPYKRTLEMTFAPSQYTIVREICPFDSHQHQLLTRVFKLVAMLTKFKSISTIVHPTISPQNRTHNDYLVATGQSPPDEISSTPIPRTTWT